MPEIAYSQLKKSLSAGTFPRVCLLHGDEPYFIDELHDLIENHLLSEADKDFNQFVLFGKDTDLNAVISKANNFPMMAENQLILVKDAQFLAQLDGRAKGAPEAENTSLRILENYLQKPVKSTYLVFSLNASLAKNTKVFKLLEHYATVFHSLQMNEQSVGEFVKTFLNSHNIQISRETIDLIVSSVGTDLKRINFELDKIVLNMPNGGEITDEVIGRLIGFTREFNFLELQNAIIDGNIPAMQKILLYFSNQTKTHNIGQTVASLYGFYTKILKAYDPKVQSANDLAIALDAKPFYAQKLWGAKRKLPLGKLINIINKLQEADLKIKGIRPGRFSDKEILEELAYHILC